MKKQLVKYYASVLVSFTAVFFLNKLINNPSVNITVIMLGFFAILAMKNFGKINIVITWVMLILFTGVLFFPLKMISSGILVYTFVMYIAIAVFYRPFSFYLNKVSVHEEVLEQSRNELEKIKETGVTKAKSDDDNVEGEIKLITALYSAVKDLGQNMNMSETTANIMAIMRKIFRRNYKVNLDNMSMALILQENNVYKIYDHSGYDEEFLKENETQFVKSVLKSVYRQKGIVYTNGPGNQDEGGGGDSLLGSVLYIPFFVGDKLLGVFFMSSSDKNIFSKTQIDNLQVLSSQIAISLEKVYLYEEVQKMSVTDSLTGLYVHRYFQEKLENEMKRASRYEHNLSIIMGDIDFFKKINDTYGHLAGDYILKNIAVLLKSNTTAADTVARYGGEEFILILPDTDKETAIERAEKIRKEIEKSDFSFKEQKIEVTMSLGVATFPGDAITRRSIVDKADKALYRAKEAGRNRVEKS